METGGPRAEDARLALELVKQHPDLLAVFEAEYRGSGEGVVALRERVASLMPHERTPVEIADEAARQKALYGRPTDGNDGISARDREQLEAEARQEAERFSALQVAIATVIDAHRNRVINEPPSPTVTLVTTAAAPASALRRARTWAVGGMVICFALGIVVAAVIASLVRTTASPGPAGSPLPLDVAASASPGYPSAARDWFTGHQSGTPVFPYPGDLRTLGVVANSIRFIQTDQSASSLWIGKTSADFCLLWTSSVLGSPTMETSCGTPAAFAHSALTISTSTTRYVWNGKSITVTSLPRP